MVSIRTLYLLIIISVYSLYMSFHPLSAITSLAKNDPYPVFTSIDPQADRFLLRKELLALDDDTVELSRGMRNHVNLSISPFAESSSSGRDIQGRVELAGQPLELGDLNGRTSMIGLMFGPLPEGKILPPRLEVAFNALFPTLTPGTLNDGSLQDPEQLFAYFSFPLRYNKRGIALESSFLIGAGFGGMVQTRISSIRQTNKDFATPFLVEEAADEAALIRAVDETPNAPAATVAYFASLGITATDVENLLMKELYPIAWELGLDLYNFCETSIEEIRFSLFWREYFELNKNSIVWPHVSIDPFFVLTGSISPGKNNPPSKRFAVPFGNDGYSALGFDTGINFAFIETIEVGAEVGFTHFFSRHICGLRIPTSKFQYGMFPWTADARVSPSYNWHFALKLSAYHFLDNLSMYFQYVIVEHCKDKIQLIQCDPAFLPDQLARLSSWKVKLANIGFMYDIAPNAALGCLWQAPISQRNTYKDNTLMLTFYAIF